MSPDLPPLGSSNQAAFPHSWPWWRLALSGLSSLALALSSYLGWHYLVGGSVIGCGGGSPCGHVLGSRWSMIAGVVPVSGLAIGTYLAILVASLCIGPASAPPVRRLAWSTMLVLVGAAAASALWFIIVQKWIIRAFCPYCTATHIIGLLLAALVLWRTPRQFADNTADPAMKPAAKTPKSEVRRIWALGGVALATLLAAGQIALAPSAVYRSGQSPQTLATLNPHSAPLLGSPQAPYVVTLLFDYQCPHCQQLHFLLNEAIRLYGGTLAFALCPTPLSRQCNPYIPQDLDEFRDSCDLAKVALAVWLANHQAFPVFDHWMFSFESGDRWRPRTLDAAKAKAIELLGQAKFEAAWADPWIGRYLQTSIHTYANTIQTGNGAIPKLVLGSRWVVPQPRDAHDLVLILQKSLALPSH